MTRTHAAAALAPQLDADVLGGRVPRDVGQRLLDDAVDDDLLVGRSSSTGRRASSGSSRAGLAAKSVDLRAQRGLQAVVVERGRAQLAREAQQLVHRLRRDAPASRAARAASSGGAAWALRLEAQQDAGQRLVDLVVQVAGEPRALVLLAAQDGVGGLRRAPPRGARACG